MQIYYIYNEEIILKFLFSSCIRCPQLRVLIFGCKLRWIRILDGLRISQDMLGLSLSCLGRTSACCQACSITLLFGSLSLLSCSELEILGSSCCDGADLRLWTLCSILNIGHQSSELCKDEESVGWNPWQI